jgi:hypothetical protein
MCFETLTTVVVDGKISIFSHQVLSGMGVINVYSGADVQRSGRHQ